METSSSGSITWLHVSDLHFGHKKELRLRIDQELTSQEIVNDAKRMLAKLGRPDFIFVTGDVAFKADAASEYPAATKWLNDLVSSVGSSADKVFIVPGNHDVDRGKVKENYTSQAAHEKLRKIPEDVDVFLGDSGQMANIWSKLEAYAEFAEPFGASVLTAERPFWSEKIDTKLGKVILVGLNTCILSYDDDDTKENLALGKKHLRIIQENSQDGLLFVLQHHPPDWLSDGHTFEAVLPKLPHILLTGHEHQQNAYLVSPLSGGLLLRFAAGAGHVKPPARHGYSWVRLCPEGVDYFPRTWNETQHTFVGDKNSFPDMNNEEAVHIARSYLSATLQSWLPASTKAKNKAVAAKSDVDLRTKRDVASRLRSTLTEFLNACNVLEDAEKDLTKAQSAGQPDVTDLRKRFDRFRSEQHKKMDEVSDIFEECRQTFSRDEVGLALKAFRNWYVNLVVTHKEGTGTGPESKGQKLLDQILAAMDKEIEGS